MTFDEVKKLAPGTNVFIMFKGEKIRGIFGTAMDAKGETPVIRFDDGAVAVVTEQVAAKIQVEVLN